MTTHHWQLYIDESGKIESDLRKPRPRPDECNVSGVLVNQERAETVKDGLERQYQQLFPWAPWPFHEGEFRYPIFHLLWLNQYIEQHAEAEVCFSKQVDATAVALKNDLTNANATGWAELTEVETAGDFAPHALRRRTRRELERVGGIQWDLFRENVERRFEALDRVTQSTLTDALIPLAFVCGESERGDAWESAASAYKEASRDERDDLPGPWGRLFIGLIRRVVLRLLTQPGNHHVDVICATRHIWHGENNRPQGISQKSIEHLVQLALNDGSALQVGRQDGEVTITVRALAPVNFAKNAAPFLIHADRLANSARVVSLYAKSLRQYQDALRARLPFVEVFHRIDRDTIIPGISAVGVAETYLHQLRTNKVPTEKPSIKNRSWAITQAEVTAHAVNSLNILWGAS